MYKLLTSASKIVFILMALSAAIGFFLKILEAKDFMMLASMAFAFYFSNKGEATEPYAGK